MSSRFANSQAEVTHVRARLADPEAAANRLRQQLHDVQAEALTLKESHGGSNKSADVIQALELQVLPSPICA